MKEHITQFLLEKGYKTYRCSRVIPKQNASAKVQNEYLFKRDDLVFTEGDRNSEYSTFYYPYDKTNDFSTMVCGGLDIRFVKDGDFKNPIIYGLHEHGKPPTLIYPRPTILRKKKSGVCNVSLYDDWMSRCLQREAAADIYEAMFDKTKSFTY